MSFEENSDNLSKSIHVFDIPATFDKSKIIASLEMAGTIDNIKYGKTDMIVTFSNSDAFDISKIYNGCEIDENYTTKLDDATSWEVTPDESQKVSSPTKVPQHVDAPSPTKTKATLPDLGFHYEKPAEPSPVKIPVQEPVREEIKPQPIVVEKKEEKKPEPVPESPKKEVKQESPKKEIKEESPKKEIKEESPKKEIKEESPKKEIIQETPKKEVVQPEVIQPKTSEKKADNWMPEPSPYKEQRDPVPDSKPVNEMPRQSQPPVVEEKPVKNNFVQAEEACENCIRDIADAKNILDRTNLGARSEISKDDNFAKVWNTKYLTHFGIAWALLFIFMAWRC